MRPLSVFPAILGCGALLALAACGPSTQQYGMCTYMGACPQDEDCKDGDDCAQEPAPKSPARPQSGTDDHGGGDTGDQ